MIQLITQGQIYMADLDPVIGSEQGGYRPVLIVQRYASSSYIPTVMVVAVSSRNEKRRDLYYHIDVECLALPKNSIALIEQVRTIDKTRLKEYLGTASDNTIEKVKQAFMKFIGMEEDGVCQQRQL